MTLSIGVLGYRFMGKAHANAFARLPMFFPDAPEVERDVLVGRNEDALAEAAPRLGFSRIETEWEAALDDVDVFYNLGPNAIHAAPSIAAIEREIPVFCEKPLAPRLRDAEEMARAAREGVVTVGCAFNYRFVPAIRYARQLIDSGDLGDIYHVRARYLQDWLVDPAEPWSWRTSQELAGSGALGDLGSHAVDLIHYLVAPIRAVSGQLTTFVDERPDEDTDESRPVTVDDAFTAQVELKNGAIGTIEASRCATGHQNDHTIEINGSRGSLRFSLHRLNELEFRSEHDRGYQTILVTDESDPYIDAWWPPGHTIGWEHTFVHENYEFLTAVRDGLRFRPNFEDGLAAQRVLAAIADSNERGRWLDVQ